MERECVSVGEVGVGRWFGMVAEEGVDGSVGWGGDALLALGEEEGS